MKKKTSQTITTTDSPIYGDASLRDPANSDLLRRAARNLRNLRFRKRGCNKCPN
jgi:hypothetical protein